MFVHCLLDQIYVESRRITLVGFFRNFPGIFGNQQQHYMEVIKRMLVQCMQDQANPQVSFDFVFLDDAGQILVTYCFIFDFLDLSDTYPGCSSGNLLCSYK